MERENERFARRLAVRIGLVVVATAVYGAVLAGLAFVAATSKTGF